LGAAALAGTGFPIDRQMTAKELGMSDVAANSLDAVSDRDFVIEFLSNASILMMHLSRFCEELILWSTPEFGFVELGDAVTTGSSIMPQKKNPDVAELIRGRVGRVYGALMGSLTMMKALPLAYNRDMQEDKVHLFSGLETTRACVSLMTIMLKNAKWNAERMEKALGGDFSNATDLADNLAAKGVSFREAHEIVGHLVQWCLKNGRKLEDLTASDLKTHHKLFDGKSVEKLSHRAVLNARTSEGGTAPKAVRAQIEKAKASL
jgi:argininosuccinate lyase